MGANKYLQKDEKYNVSSYIYIYILNAQREGLKPLTPPLDLFLAASQNQNGQQDAYVNVNNDTLIPMYLIIFYTYLRNVLKSVI